MASPQGMHAAMKRVVVNLPSHLVGKVLSTELYARRIKNTCQSVCSAELNTDTYSKITLEGNSFIVDQAVKEINRIVDEIEQSPMKSVVVNLPSCLVGKILAIEPYARRIMNICFVCTSAVLDDSTYSKITLVGKSVIVDQAEKEIGEIVYEIQQNIRSVSKRLHCKYLPLFGSSEVEACINEIQRMRVYEVSIQGVPIKEFSRQIRVLQQSRNPLQTYDTKSCTFCSTTADSEFVWYVKDDNGRYTEVEQSVNEKLNSCLQDQKDAFLHSKYLFKVNIASTNMFDTLYKVDFASMNLLDTSTNVTRPLRKENTKWLFEIKGTESYGCHPDDISDSIEKMYHFGGTDIRIAGARQTIDFTNSSQIDLLSFEHVQLKRHPHLSNDVQPVRKVMIKVEGLLDNVQEAAHKLVEALDSRLHSVTVPCPMIQTPCERVQISNFLRQYCIEFSEFPSSQQVKLEGARDYVSTIQHLFEQFLLRFQQHSPSVPRDSTVPQDSGSQSQASSGLPAHWKPTDGNDCACVSVKKDSDEWKNVLAMMRNTMPRVQITQLERVQNRPLWEKYRLEAVQMRERNNGEINEMTLFHGTRKVDPKGVACSRTGLDFRLSNDKNLWGRGAYCAFNASYSCGKFAYTLPNGLKQVLLVSVLTGKSYSYGNKYARHLVQPPKGYDSVNGFTNDSQVYVVYEHNFSCPAYIITYRS